MRSQHARPFSRRRFLGRLSLAGTAGLLGLRPAPVAAEPPPETKRIRLIKITGICVAPQYVADELLHAEGFTDVEYIPATADVAQIYQLQAAFHRAKSAQDIELMMSLWDPKATLKVQGDPQSPYVGTEQLRGFWLQSGSFKNRRFSLVPSFKTRITVRDNEADLYFECHDVADYDQPTRNIINNSFLAGTLRHVGGKWVFYNMSAGPSTPLSLDRYYA